MQTKIRRKIARQCSWCGEEIEKDETPIQESWQRLTAYYHIVCFYAAMRGQKLLMQLKGAAR